VIPLALATALALAAAPWGSAPPVAQARAKAQDASTYPPEQRARWPLVVQKCGRCHSMDVSLNQNYSPAEWKASMRRMVRLPGAGISPQQAAEILDFLRFYSTGAPRG
jgi:cytochrome c553